MSDKSKTDLKHIEWMRVRMLSITGATIHLTTDEGPFIFEFASEAEAGSALDEWFTHNGCTLDSFNRSQ